MKLPCGQERIWYKNEAYYYLELSTVPAKDLLEGAKVHTPGWARVRGPFLALGQCKVWALHLICSLKAQGGQEAE